ncbi:MAG: rod shape-determining protein [Planctomycetes bacterium]|nr:rod shape-determining protein [Planctomycetota bacterium]
MKDKAATVRPDIVAPAAGGNGNGATQEEEILYLGIDLGTSRSSVAASNGIRETVASVVGYPKDEVAQKMLGRSVVFGDEALRRRLSLHLYRPLENGVIKFSDDPESQPEESARHLRAAGDLIRYIISLAKPKSGQLVFGVIGAPSQASQHNKRAILNAAREVLDSVLITSEPFSVAYGLDELDDALVIDIGAGTVDLCRMHGSFPTAEDQVTLTTAGDYVDKVFEQLLRKRYENAQFNRNMVKRIKEKYGFVTGTNERIQVDFPVDGRPTSHDITEDLRTACASIVDPIVKSIHKLIASFDPEFQERLRHNVVISGGGSQIIGLGKVIEERLADMGGGRVTVVEEPVYAGANGSLKLAYDMPKKYWEVVK